MVETCSFLKNFLNNGKSRTNTCTDNCMLCAMPIMINRSIVMFHDSTLLSHVSIIMIV